MSETAIRKKEDILLDIEEKLKEEKWTRAAIESYSVKNFIELDSIIRLAISEEYKDELKTLCRENLKHYQNSIVGLYIIGVLSLEESSIDDTHIPQLVKLFMDNKKFKIAEFLAEKVLSYRENKYALKTLETLYESYGNQEELFNIKRRLVLIDNRDAGNAKFLGEHYEKMGDKDQAMFYYRLAIERYILSRSIKLIEDLWNKVLKLYPEDSNLVIAMARKTREVLGDERVADMAFTDFVKHAIKNEKYKDALKVLKLVIDLKPSEKAFRKAIEDCYRVIYGSHSQLDKYLRLSAIGQSWKPHKEAIRVFETHIAFDKGIYVSHKSWGIGVVKEIENDKVTIDFESKKGHEMSLEIALRALTVLDGDHIVIWKKYKHDELKKLLHDEPLHGLEIILRSQNGEATTSDIKNYLVPDVLKESEWNKWWAIAKKYMEGSNIIVQNLNKRNVVELRESEITVVDELVSKFKKTTNFENKVKLLTDFKIRGGDINAISAQALYNYFTEILKAQSESSERKLVSLVALKYADETLATETLADASVIFGIKNLLDFYNGLDQELKKTYLIILKKLKDWDLKYLDIITHSNFNKLDLFMVKQLEEGTRFEVINSVFMTSMNGYQDNPELFVGLSRYILLDESLTGLKDRLGVRENEILFRLLSLYDIMQSEIDQKTSVGRNNKVVNDMNDLLFKKGFLDTVIDSSDESTIRSIFTLLSSSVSVDSVLKEEPIAKIVGLYPVLKKTSKQEKILIRHPFLVTKRSLEGKKQELNRLVTAEIPENSRAIGEAMEKGDLRENAEYKAALEKQDQLKAAASKLESDLNQAKVIEKSAVDTSMVNVGTKVTVKNESGKKELYQILGQWDVDLANHVISYHSPIGRSFLDKKVGDTLVFDQNNEKKTFEILDISLADFE